MRVTETTQVLILEDEALLRKSLARMLERQGHTVLTAASIGEARSLLESEAVDAAILDVGLPDGNGLDLLPLTGVKQSLVISAEVDDQRLYASGVEHFLRKPLELRSVAQCVEILVLAESQANCGNSRTGCVKARAQRV